MEISVRRLDTFIQLCTLHALPLQCCKELLLKLQGQGTKTNTNWRKSLGIFLPTLLFHYKLFTCSRKRDWRVGDDLLRLIIIVVHDWDRAKRRARKELQKKHKFLSGMYVYIRFSSPTSSWFAFVLLVLLLCWWWFVECDGKHDDNDVM